MSSHSRTFWQRWRFHLNGLLLILPFWYLYQSLNPAFPAAWPQQAVGPFTATPVPSDTDEPYEHDGALVKDFSVKLCAGCVEKIRQAYVSVGPQPAASPQGYEGILHGNNFGLHAHVPFPHQLQDDDLFWITLEEWNGERHHGAWSLDQVGIVEWRSAAR